MKTKQEGEMKMKDLNVTRNKNDRYLQEVNLFGCNDFKLFLKFQKLQITFKK